VSSSKKSTPAANHFSQLSADEVLATVRALRTRISERFPDRGLNGVCTELENLCSRSRERLEWIAKPNWPLRITRYVLVAIIVVGVIASFFALKVELHDAPLTLIEIIQALESAINDIVLISVGVFFIWTLEARLKRRRALTSLHELRSIAHVIDMHQLTKDPDRIISGRCDTQSSPRDRLSAFDLRRYLDYCSEMLSLVGKVAALHLQSLDDSTVVASVNEIEDLTTGLSQKVWQKIEMVRIDEGLDSRKD